MADPVKPTKTAAPRAAKATVVPLVPVPADPVVPAAPAAMAPAPAALPGEDKSMTNEATANFTAAATNTMNRAMDTVVPAMEKASADTMAQAKVQFDTLNAKMAEMMEQSMKSVTEMNEFAKGNLDAMIASAKAATAGAETLTAAMVETSKKSFEEAQHALKAMTSAKTPNEALQLQSDFAKAQFEKTVATWSHMSETMLKVSGDVFQPLSSRMAVAAESVKKAMAA